MQTPAELIHFFRDMKSFIKGGGSVTITGEGTEQFPLIISSTGGEGIQSIIAGDNILIDNTDPRNPIVFVNITDELEEITDTTKIAVIDNNGILKYAEKGDISEEVTQYFLPITEAGKTGYVHKYRADNPNYYGDIGNNAIDLSYSTDTSSIMGALGGHSFLTGLNNRTSISGYISVIIGGENNHVKGVKQNIIGGSDNKNMSSSAQNSVILGGKDNTITGSSGSNSVILGGSDNLTFVDNTFLTGVGNIGRNSGEILLGKYSTDYIPTGKNSLRLFNIGFGDNASSRKDLFSILRSGKVGIGYNLFNPQNDSELLQVNGSVLIENTLKLNDYGEGNITGTATKMLAVDATGNVIEEDLPTSGSNLTVTDNDAISVSSVDTINFIGATVTDNTDGSVDVEFSGGGSSISIGTDGQIPFTNSSNDDFEYSDNFKLNEYGVLKLENTWLGGGALSLEDGNKVGQITPDYIQIGDDSGSNPYFNLTSNDMFFRRNDIGTYPSLRLANTGTGDVGIGFLAGSRGVTMGIDNSDGDLFKISVGSSIPNVGAGTVILEADNNQIKLPIYGSGTITGTATKLLAVDADGKVIEEDLPSGGGESLVKRVKVTVTPAEMLDLANNPVELIPAQGAGTTINILGATAFLDFNSVAYDFSGGLYGVYLQEGNQPYFSLGYTAINSGTDNYMTFYPNANNSTSGINNSAVVLTHPSNPTQGDSPVTIIIDYTVHDYN